MKYQMRAWLFAGPLNPLLWAVALASADGAGQFLLSLLFFGVITAPVFALGAALLMFRLGEGPFTKGQYSKAVFWAVGMATAAFTLIIVLAVGTVFAYEFLFPDPLAEAVGVRPFWEVFGLYTGGELAPIPGLLFIPGTFAGVTLVCLVAVRWVAVE